MATRYNAQMDKVRVGSNQTSRYGSMSMGKNGFRISVSTYRTDYPENTPSENANLQNKIKILETIVHEFAHITLYQEGKFDVHHGPTFTERLNRMLVKDWKELVKIYNFIEQDNLTDNINFVIALSGDPHVTLRHFTEARRRYDEEKS